MKLIADSGSTKTDWTLLHDTGRRADEVFVKTFKTQGITPVHQSPAEIRQILVQELMPQLSTFSRAELVHSKILKLLCFQISMCFSMAVVAHQPMYL